MCVPEDMTDKWALIMTQTWYQVLKAAYIFIDRG